jgi:hypothetical protein
MIRVFGYEIGHGTGEIKALRWTSCETSGGFSTVDSISDVKLQSKAHLSKLSEPLAYSIKSKPVSKRPVTFSFAYMDSQSEGAVSFYESLNLNNVKFRLLLSRHQLSIACSPKTEQSIPKTTTVLLEWPELTCRWNVCV